MKGPTSPKRGRPANPKARRTARCEIRLHPDELAQLRDKAAASGDSIADYIRRVCGLTR